MKLTNGVILIERSEELPTLPSRIETLYLDVETSSLHPEVAALNPWKVDECRLWLVAFTWDDCPFVYCVPRGLANIIGELFRRSRTWVNQNIKYDVHVCYNDGGFKYDGELHDTLTLGKLVDSDRTYKGGYGLDAMAKHYCGIDLSWYYVSLRPFLDKNKDYGRVHLPTLADYAGNQVRANRILHAELLRLLPEETRPVWETEKRLTTTLIAIERRGMRTNIDGVHGARYRSLNRMMVAQEKLEDMLGYVITPSSHTDCEDLFINRFQLPKIYKQHKDGTQSKSPSFEKAVLKSYMLLEGAPVDIIRLVTEYRHESTMCGLFWEPWLQLHVDGVLHSSYNQIVRSGRTSCSMPNSQQFNDEARGLIIPRDGFALVCKDYSQIEYRIIIHYTNNRRIVAIYVQNPDADFHQLMADEVGIDRKPAKILNLAMGYQMGKKKTIATLRIDPSIIKATGGDPRKAIEIATSAYFGFHRRLPEVKQHAKMAEHIARVKGYVRNAYGRRCHLPLISARVAFNRVCQSHAADLMKERTNALHDRIQELDYEAHLLASVHDETVSEVEADRAHEYGPMAQTILNDVSIPMRVPVRCSCGISGESWLDAKRAGDRKPVAVEASPGTGC